MAKAKEKKPIKLQDKNPVSVIVDGVQLNAKRFNAMPEAKALARIKEITGKDDDWATAALKACKEKVAGKEEKADDEEEDK